MAGCGEIPGDASLAIKSPAVQLPEPETGVREFFVNATAGLRIPRRIGRLHFQRSEVAQFAEHRVGTLDPVQTALLNTASNSW